jgi:outer membrane protein TolC
LNFKVKVDSAKSTLIGAKYDLKNAKIILAQLMGLSESALDENIQFPQLNSDNDVALQDIKLYLDLALANRPDLKLYRENMKSNQYALYAKYGTYWPVLMANASSEFVSSDKNADNGVDPEYDSNNYTYGVSLSWDLFDGFARDNAVKEAEAILKQSEIDLESTWISVVQEVKTAYNTYIQRSQQYVLLNEIVELQKKTRDLVEIEYKTGTVELTRLNEAQKDYIVAENQMIGALIDVYNAKAQLEAAINSKL